MDNIKKKIKVLAEAIAAQHAVELVDIDLVGSSGRPIIRIYIDKENGVSLEDCGGFSRALSALFDVEDPIPTAYVLEVSSPGLDRPLRESKDFQRSIGKLAKVVTKMKIAEQNVFIGRITGVTGEDVSLSFEDKEIRIAFDQISKARLEIELK